MSICCFFGCDFWKSELFKNYIYFSGLLSVKLPQERIYLNSQCGAEILNGTLRLAAQKLHSPCCFCMQHRLPDCRAALMLWFLHCHRFVSPPRCHGTLNQEDSFWSQALQDLETCGQSEILRELEVGPSCVAPTSAKTSDAR